MQECILVEVEKFGSQSYILIKKVHLKFVIFKYYRKWSWSLDYTCDHSHASINRPPTPEASDDEGEKEPTLHDGVNTKVSLGCVRCPVREMHIGRSGLNEWKEGSISLSPMQRIPDELSVRWPKDCQDARLEAMNFKKTNFACCMRHHLWRGVGPCDQEVHGVQESSLILPQLKACLLHLGEFERLDH